MGWQSLAYCATLEMWLSLLKRHAGSNPAPTANMKDAVMFKVAQSMVSSDQIGIFLNDMEIVHFDKDVVHQASLPRHCEIKHMMVEDMARLACEELSKSFKYDITRNTASHIASAIVEYLESVSTIK